ncbi:MAG TPA: HlyD family efflux transporter periplasmic adaptor subunit [Gemmatimonadales bacterium]
MDIKRAPKKKTGRYVAIGAGVLTLVAVTILLSGLKPAAPTVERAGLWFGVVKRGPMLREVHGPGQLRPEQIRYISAVTGGRVDQVMVRPGATVHANTILLEMSNPDVELQALTAQQQLSAAQAQLVSLRTQLVTGRLNQQGVVADMRNQLREAQRQSSSGETLAQRNLIAANDLAKARDLVTELTERLHIEQDRLDLMTSTVDSQLSLQRDQIARLRDVAEYNRQRVQSLHVNAGVDGVVQDLTLQPGQWVQSGTEMAQVLQPGRLKAELKIPETQARDVALGQSADIDTRVGHVPGHVIRMDPGATNGTVTVDVSLEGPLPQGARPDLQIEGTIEIERLTDVLSVPRPAYGQPNSSSGVFKTSDGGKYGNRVNVRFGRASVNDIEVVGGLKVGDEIILSDMTRWDNVDRVRIK